MEDKSIWGKLYKSSKLLNRSIILRSYLDFKTYRLYIFYCPHTIIKTL